jgi:hypothetical protein
VGWWTGKVGQAVRYLTAGVADDERRELAVWLTPAQLRLFDSMHRVDQRHGLDVVNSLRRAGHAEDDLVLAGLFHDAGKGRATGLPHRVAWSLGERYGPRVWIVTSRLPGFDAGLERMREHSERSAQLALRAGCSSLTADLIRYQAAPRHPALGEALRIADEAN